MPIPEFDDEGDLPPGVHEATLPEVLARFGAGTVQRRIVSSRLVRIFELASSTGKLGRFVVIGSFVTQKPEPRDVDIVLIMDDSFDLSAVSREVAVVFNHHDADAQLGASVFWSTRSGALGGEQAMIEYWQLRRDGGLRGMWRSAGGRNDSVRCTTFHHHGPNPVASTASRPSATDGTEPVNYRASTSGFLAEIDRMQREVREFLSAHPKELAGAV